MKNFTSQQKVNESELGKVFRRPISKKKKHGKLEKKNEKGAIGIQNLHINT